MLASYIEAVREYAPNAEIVFDRYQVQRLAHDALDRVRREQVREVRGTEDAKELKGTRWALQKNPWNLTLSERGKLSSVQRTNRALYRGYLLKETLCAVLDRRHPLQRQGVPVALLSGDGGRQGPRPEQQDAERLHVLGLSKPPRAPRDPLAALERAWERYHGNVTALVKDGVTEENRSKVVSTIRKHAQVIESLRERVA